MYINRLTSINNIKNQSRYSLSGDKNFALKKCLPQKSSVSFRGNYLDDIYAMFTNELSSQISDTLVRHKREIYVGSFVDALSMNKGRQFLKFNRKMSTQDIIRRLYSALDPTEAKYVNELFLSSGINNAGAFEHFLRAFHSRPDSKSVFYNQEIEAIEIYGQLKSKEDLGRYSQLLLYLHNYNKTAPDDSRVDLNSILDFLKKVDIKDFRDFDSRFAYYKGYFNDFATLSDRVEAISYLQYSYDSKMNLVDDSIIKNPQAKLPKAEKIYSSQGDLIDYLYEINGGESLGPFSLIVDTVSSADKIKASVRGQFAPYFNSFETPKDKVDFHLFLHECNSDISDLNSLSSPSVIEEYPKLISITNKTPIVSKISAISGQNSSVANSIYRSHNDLFNVLFIYGEGNSSPIETFLGVIKQFNLKDSSATLSLYNKICSTNKKKLTPEEFIEFVQLMAFCPSGDIFKLAKASNTTPLNLLDNERAGYLRVKDQIEDFLTSDDSNYFTGKSALQIYSEYRDLLNSTNNVAQALQNISSFAMGNDSNVAQKTLRIEQLQQYFSDRKSFIDFIDKNDIKFDLSQDDEERIANCLRLFSLSAQTGHLDYFINSGFIKNSVSGLADFIKSYKSDTDLKDVLATIATRNIDSLESFNALITKYSSPNGEYKNLLTALNNLPEEVDFASFMNTLHNIEQKLKRCNISVPLNNDNILMIDPLFFDKDNIILVTDIANLFAKLLNADDGNNFILGLSNALQKKDCDFSKFQIANEFVSKFGKDKESYHNLNRIFGLDKHTLRLESSCSDYIYTDAVRQILPDDFIDFINSDSWLPKFNGATPNMTLHARLRFIDRFGLSDCATIDELYTQATKEKLKNILESVYCTTPTALRGSSGDHRIIINTMFDDTLIESVFTQNGRMVTLVPRKY